MRSAGRSPTLRRNCSWPDSISAAAASRKVEARLSYVDDKTLLYLAEVLKVPVQDLFRPEPQATVFTTSWRNWRQRDSEAED